MFVDEHMYYVNQIKTANNAVGDRVLFFFGKSSDAVEWSSFFLFHWIKWQMRHMKMQWGSARETND